MKTSNIIIISIYHCLGDTVHHSFCSSPLHIFKLSLQVPWIDSRREFFEGKRIHSMRWCWQRVFAGIRTPDPWVPEQKFYNGVIWLDDWPWKKRISNTNYFVDISIECTHISQNDHLWTVSNKMLRKNNSKIDIRYNRCLFDENVTRTLKQEGNWRSPPPVGKWVEFLWLRVVIIYACTKRGI